MEKPEETTWKPADKTVEQKEAGTAETEEQKPAEQAQKDVKEQKPAEESHQHVETDEVKPEQGILYINHHGIIIYLT